MRTELILEFPDTIEEALEMLAADDPAVRVIGGGTGIVPLMKHGLLRPTTLVALHRLGAALSTIEQTDDGGFRLGASVTLRTLERSRQLMQLFPLLSQALAVLATVRVRNVAQLGGAVAHAHPQTDLPPVLVSLGARIRARSSRGERWIDASEMFLGYYESALRDDELITEVRLPSPGRHRATYRKVTERTVDDWPLLGVAAIARPDASARRVQVVLGSVADHPLTLPEMAFPPGTVGHGVIESIVRDATSQLELSDRPGATARYQRQLIAVHTGRAVQEVLSGIVEGGEV